jgi:hypothetical protein
VNEKSTLVFVIEISGKSVLAFNAESQVDDERKAERPMLCSDLMVFETADGPIWNGADEIVVREAHIPTEPFSQQQELRQAEPCLGLAFGLKGVPPPRPCRGRR